MVIVRDAEGARAHDVRGDTGTESLFIREERQLQGKWGRVGSYSFVQQPKWIETDVPQEPTTKGQKATWTGQAREFAGRTVPIRYKVGKVHHERS